MSDLKNAPLKGVGILVTRAEDQAADMIQQLKNLGASVYSFPVIVIEPLSLPTGLQTVLDRISSYERLIFTSANGVRVFAGHLEKAGIDPRDVPMAVCVGPRTAEAWKASGGQVSDVPKQFSGEGVVEMLGSDLTGRSYLILRPETVKTNLAALLTDRGAVTDQLILYRTGTNPDGNTGLHNLMEGEDVDVVTFTSPSSVEGLIQILGSSDALKDKICLCIGPTTSKAAIEAGLERVYHPEEFTVEGILQILPALLNRGAERRIT